MSYSLDESIKVHSRVGDVDPLNDGGAILDHGDGRPNVVYLVACEDGPTRQCEVCDGACSLLFHKYTVDLLDIDDAVNGPGNQWVDVDGVASSCGTTAEDLRALAMSEDLRDKFSALYMVAGYHGWDEFDSYPVPMNHKEAEEFSSALDEAEKRGKEN